MKAVTTLVVVVVLQMVSGQGIGSGQSPALSTIMCQLFLGDIPLCPASSCKELADLKVWNLRSGQHWLNVGDTLLKAYCTIGISPSQSPGWMRVAYVSSSRGCPAGLEELTVSDRKLWEDSRHWL